MKTITITPKQFKEVSSCHRRKTQRVITPQFSAEKRPDHFCGDQTYGYTKDKKYQCAMCSYESIRQNTIQQHCLKHFPPLHHCEECGDKFHLKTGLINHYEKQCLECLKIIKVGSIPGHKCNPKIKLAEAVHALNTPLVSELD